MRIEILYKTAEIDGRASRVLNNLKSTVSDKITAAAVIDVYLIEGFNGLTQETAAALFSDVVAQDCCFASPAALLDARNGFSYLVEITTKPGVTNTESITTRELLEAEFGDQLPHEVLVQTAKQYLVYGEPLSEAEQKKLKKTLHNALIEACTLIEKKDFDKGVRCPDFYPHQIAPSQESAQNIPVLELDGAQLEKLSKDRLLSLTQEEMKVIQAYYQDPKTQADRKSAGLQTEPTDVELEMIAQTWSEHCKHKIFAAIVDYTDGENKETIKGLFSQYIKKTTDDVSKTRKFLKSVFHDNSGMIAFTKDWNVCFKVETHNSPSALDPYGGAMTGIVGVNRDILGTGIGAKPIFNTNYLCFGPLDTPESDIPEGLLHPIRVQSGVHHGIVDGGNQSGIPVVAGGFLYDDSYLGKPLVFCGTGGILPSVINGAPSEEKHVSPGSFAIMLGGRIGKDGIHGATFSSLALDETSPTSAVQIGDPIIQKKMTDFILEARDLGLYEGITDNGAGGLSSSLGEMCQDSGGLSLNLDDCPLKYPHLAPWEILVSESQERMSLSVTPDKLDAFLALAKKRSVEATVIGTFTDSGFIDIYFRKKIVAHLSIRFLHDGLPKMNIKAVWIAPTGRDSKVDNNRDLKKDILALMAEPNIASKEHLIRQYDHEVQGKSVIKPFNGIKADGPSDGAVFVPLYDDNKGLTVTHGVCPRYSDIDAYQMAANAVDEAYRAHIGLGGDPELASALDNFCWPDPVKSDKTPDGEYKMAQLVRACKGLQDACIAYGLPLISGKDSMKNDANIGGKKVSVRPTLLVSLMGIINDAQKATTTDFKKPGDLIYLAGNTKAELAGTRYEQIADARFSSVPTVNFPAALSLYKKISKAIETGLLASVHDLSEGGLAVALCESSLSGRLGADIDIQELCTAAKLVPAEALFSESPSRFLVSVPKEKAQIFENLMRGEPIFALGKVNEKNHITIKTANNEITLPVDQIVSAFLTHTGAS